MLQDFQSDTLLNIEHCPLENMPDKSNKIDI